MESDHRNQNPLDSTDRIHEIRSIIQKKASLRLYYLEIYQKYLNCLKHCPSNGIILELGSGGGFIKEIIPQAVTSDILPYEGIDLVVDATKMPFQNESISVIFMSNVFHHIPDVEAFFNEATRCLVPGGKILIIDQYCGWFSSIIYKNFHHENFNPKSKVWKFESNGPLSDANGALASIVFNRDLSRFHSLWPLKVTRFEPHSPLRYWWMGGLKSWSLLPAWAFKFATTLDHFLVKISAGFASFVDIEIIK